MSIDADRLIAAQKRVLVLGRFNADAYNPRSWWKPDSKTGRKALLYRFQVSPDGTAPPGIIALLERGDRVAALYEHLCPGFREEVRVLKLSDQSTQVAFTAAATPAREELPESGHPAVTLYPGHPLLDTAATGFDLLTRIALDIDRLIRFEHADGYAKLLRLFNRYNTLYGGVHATNLPNALTRFGHLPAELAAVVLDAVFAPGAVYVPTAGDRAALESVADDLRLKYDLLLDLVRGFRRVCTARGASVIRPTEDGDEEGLSREALDVSGVAEGFDTAKYLADLQAARDGLNRTASTVQSNLLLGSVVAWLLAGNTSQVAAAAQFDAKTEEAFRLGVAEAGVQLIGADLRKRLRERMEQHLLKTVADERARDRLLRLYDLGEPHLCNIPVFRVEGVVELANEEAKSLLDEALAEGDRQAMEEVKTAAQAANKRLTELLDAGGRRELLIPGLTLALPQIQVGAPGNQLTVDFTADADARGVRVVVRGPATRENVKLLFEDAQVASPDVAYAVYQAFYQAQTVLPPEMDSQLDDKVITAYASELEKTDEKLTEANAPLRAGFTRAVEAVQQTAIAEARPLPKDGGIWERTTAAGAGHAIGTTGLRDTKSRGGRYNRDAAAALPPAPNPAAALETDILRLADDAREYAKAGGADPAAGESLVERAAVCEKALAELDGSQDRFGRWTRLVRAVLAVLFEARVRSAVTEAMRLSRLEPRDEGLIETTLAAVGALAAEQAAHTDPEAKRLTPLASPDRLRRWAEMLKAAEQILTKPDDKVAGTVTQGLAELGKDKGAAGEMEPERNWLVVLRQADAPLAPPRPAVSDEDLGHYFNARQTILRKYVDLAVPGTDGARDFCGRTRYVWFAQLLVHLHKRMPLAQGRADAGNVAGLVMEAIKCWRPPSDTVAETAEARLTRQDEIRRVFFARNAGKLPSFLPVQTLAHVQSLARGYRDKTLESIRTLRDMRIDLTGLEYLISRLPVGGEVVIVNMTADDFVALEWDRCPELFDAYRLRAGQDEEECLLPSALLVTRSAQRWAGGNTAAQLGQFIRSLDAKALGSALSGRCTLPPVFVAVETDPRVADPDPDADPLAVRRGEADALRTVAQRLEALRPNLSFPVFAVGMTAVVRPPAGSASHAPYFLLARLCGGDLLTATATPSPLAVKPDPTASPPTDPAALPFSSTGDPGMNELVDDWFGRPDRQGVIRRLGADFYAWLVSVIFRAEIGAGAPHNLPTPDGFRATKSTAPLEAFWRHFLPVGLPPTPTEVGRVAEYDLGYLRRPPGAGPVPGAAVFGGWKFINTAGKPPNSWAALTSPGITLAVTRTPAAGTPVPVPWLQRLLTRLYS